MKQMVSVVITTYNGHEYIVRQLDSIRKQTRMVDEVIISDDQSSDDTVELIENYIECHGLDNWHVYINANNLGWKKNFHVAIRKATGDVVFFCDQDDIWHEKKIERMLKAFESNSDMEVLACRTRFIDGYDKSITVSSSALPFGYEKKKYKKTLERNCVNNKFLYTIMPGCTMCVKKELINRLYDTKHAELLPHDALFWKIGTLLGSAYVYNVPLINYRIHDNNASNPNASSQTSVKSLEVRKDEATVYRDQIKAVIAICRDINYKHNFSLLRKLLEFTSWRISFLERKHLLGFLTRVRYYRNIKMAIGDVLSILKG